MNNFLILIHGYPFDRTLWNRVESFLGPHILPLALDLPGFGATPASLAEPSLEVMADTVIDFIQTRQIRPVVIAGFSMGGYVSLAVADRRPDLLAGLALIDSQARADSDETREARRQTIAKVRLNGPAAAVAAALPRMFAASPETIPALVQQVNSGAAKAGVAGICWALEAMARRPDRSAVLKTLSIPTLIVHGEKDQFIPFERAQAEFSLLRNGRFVPVYGGGHATPLEVPHLVADALSQLVAACF